MDAVIPDLDTLLSYRRRSRRMRTKLHLHPGQGPTHHWIYPCAMPLQKLALHWGHRWRNSEPNACMYVCVYIYIRIYRRSHGLEAWRVGCMVWHGMPWHGWYVCIYIYIYLHLQGPIIPNLNRYLSHKDAKFITFSHAFQNRTSTGENSSIAIIRPELSTSSPTGAVNSLGLSVLAGVDGLRFRF